MHRWRSDEVSETIDIALMHRSGTAQRNVAAEDLADRISDRTPSNPLTASAAATAIEAADRAIDGDYSMAASDLTQQVNARRAAGTLIRRYARSNNPDDEADMRLIDVCLLFPPGDERLAAAAPYLRNTSVRILDAIDEAIDGRYPERGFRPSLRRLIEQRRREGTLVRQYTLPRE